MNHIIWWHIRVFNKKHFSDFNYFELLGQQLFFIPLLLLFFGGEVDTQKFAALPLEPASFTCQ